MLIGPEIRLEVPVRVNDKPAAIDVAPGFFYEEALFYYGGMNLDPFPQTVVR